MPEAHPSYNNLTDQDRINVMVVGSGGRERALAWKLAQSNRIGNLSIVPSGPDLLRFAQDPANPIDLAVIGPDDDLARGIVDDFTRAGIPTFGPTQQAARIESSKPHAKRLMAENGVPTAAFSVFDNPDQAHEYIDIHG